MNSIIVFLLGMVCGVLLVTLSGNNSCSTHETGGVAPGGRSNTNPHQHNVGDCNKLCICPTLADGKIVHIDSRSVEQSRSASSSTEQAADCTQPQVGDRGNERAGPLSTLLRRMQLYTVRSLLAPYKLFIFDEFSDKIISQSIRRGQSWQEELFSNVSLHLARVQSTLGRTPHFVDIGANIGTLALRARSLGSRVTALEPVAHHYQALVASLLENGFHENVTLFPLVASDHTGELCDLFTSSKNTGHSMMACGATENDAAQVWDTVKRTTAAQNMYYSGTAMTARLDDIINRRDVVDVLKMDCEGCEWLALQGATQLFESRRIGVVFMEYVPRLLSAVSNLQSPSPLIDFVTKHGCAFWNQQQGKSFAKDEIEAYFREIDRLELDIEIRCPTLEPRPGPLNESLPGSVLLLVFALIVVGVRQRRLWATFFSTRRQATQR